jgi:hypothetical protein
MKKKTKKIPPKYLELSVIFAVVIVSFFLWNTLLIYPIKLFVVMWHEISHGIAAIFTGGRVHAIEFSLELGGKCLTEDGIPFIVASSGYLGSVVIGASLFRTSYDMKAGRWLCTGLAILLVLFAANFVTTLFGGIVSTIFAVLLFVSPRYLPTIIHNYLWRSLGLMSVIYVIIDIKQDILINTYIKNDAHMIAEITGISATIWGVLWFFTAIVTAISLVVYAYKKA